jgi:hypothetical protein
MTFATTSPLAPTMTTPSTFIGLSSSGPTSSSTSPPCSDVTLVFQNALAFNVETTAIAQASLKLSMIFERLFFEYVLDLDHNPLGHPEGCLLCRVSEDEEENDDRIILCDRCDGYYHIDCLSSFLSSSASTLAQISTRTEWYCPACVEEREIFAIHPLRNAVVVSSSGSGGGQCGEVVEDYGRVVGIIRRETRQRPMTTSTSARHEQGHAETGEDAAGGLEYYLEYQIEFGYAREEAHEEGSSVSLTKSRNRSEKTEVWMVNDVLRHFYGISSPQPQSQNQETLLTSSSPPPTLPSGYAWDQYDALASISHGYAGWLEVQSAFPPCLDVWYSKAAYVSHLNQDRVEFIRQAIFPLMSRGCRRRGRHEDGEMWSEDWVNLLLGVAYKTMTMPKFVDKGNAINELSQSDYAQILANLENHQPPKLDDYRSHFTVVITQTQTQGGGGDTLLFEWDAELQSSHGDEVSSDGEDGDEEEDEGKEEEGSDEICSVTTEGSKGSVYDLFSSEEVGAITQQETTPGTEEAVDLEQRNKTIQRASEDALLCLRLLTYSDEHLSLLEAITLEEDESLGHPPSRSTVPGEHQSSLLSHFLPGGYLHSVVKFCLPKFGEDGSDISLWLSTFCHQLEIYFLEFLKRNGREREGETRRQEERCGWCKYTELELCSQFMKGSCYFDWEAMRASGQGGWDEEEGEMEVVVQEEEGGGETGVGHEGKRRRGMRRETFPVHQFCAEMMKLRREKIFQKRQQLLSDDNDPQCTSYNLSLVIPLADTLCGLARGKVLSIGSDRFGNFFYCFPGSPSLFMCHHSSPSSNTSVTPRTEVWRVYSTAVEVCEILLRLDGSGGQRTCEKLLKNVLKALFPEAAALLPSRAHLVDLSPPVDLVTSLRKIPRLGFDSLCGNESVLHEVRGDQGEEGKVEPEELDDVSDAIDEEDSSLDGSVDDEVATEAVPVVPAVSVSAVATVGSDEEVEWDDSADFIPRIVPTVNPKKRKNETQLLLESNGAHGHTSRSSNKKPRSDDAVVATLRSSQHSPLTIGGKVIVSKGERYFEGKILSISPPSSGATSPSDPTGGGEPLYKIRFLGWGAEYDSWLPQSCLLPHSLDLLRSHLKTTTSATPAPSSCPSLPPFSDDEDEEDDISAAPPPVLPPLSPNYRHLPPILRSLFAFQHLHASNRYNTQYLYSHTSEPLIPNLTFLHQDSNQLNELLLLKVALLIIQSALPRGALEDDNEDKWTLLPSSSSERCPPQHPKSSFISAWRHGVIAASCCQQVMEYELLLEYCLKPSWYRPLPLKLLSCLPSRAHCLRYPAESLLAMRVWSLDQAIKYDKVAFETSALAVVMSGKGKAGGGSGGSKKAKSGKGHGGAKSSKGKEKK